QSVWITIVSGQIPFSELEGASGTAALALATLAGGAALLAVAAEDLLLQAGSNKSASASHSLVRRVRSFVMLCFLVVLSESHAFDSPRYRSMMRASTSKTKKSNRPSSDDKSSAVISCSVASRW